MAKSKSGGTRSYLRGRIASDVYSIGRDSNGKKQQVVRSLAEQVANPQTVAQMRGRMIMSTVMQAVSAMAPIIDHSFDNVPNGQPSISEFIRLNYALVKADVAAHPSEDNNFGLNKYQEKGCRNGKWQISDGKATLPDTVVEPESNFDRLTFGFVNENTTIAALKTSMGWAEGDYLTNCFLSGGKLLFYRVKFANTLPDTTVITSDNVRQVLNIEDPFGVLQTVSIYENAIRVGTSKSGSCGGVIFTKKTADGFEHSKCFMNWNIDGAWTADVALPTYPVGAERFLNGGEL